MRQFLLTNLVRTPGSKTMHWRIPVPTLTAALGSLGDFPFKDPGAARYEGSTLFVRGTKSNYVPDDVLPLIGTFFPRFELHSIDAGHWVMSERPEELRQGKCRYFPTIDAVFANDS